jgi:hypothetical protein
MRLAHSKQFMCRANYARNSARIPEFPAVLSYFVHCNPRRVVSVAPIGPSMLRNRGEVFAWGAA